MSTLIDMGTGFQKLNSVGKLAQLLNVAPDELFWLANQRDRFSDDASQAKHYRFRWIRKRKTGWRLIEAPRSRLKFVQRQLLDSVFADVSPHPLAFGFCRGRDVIDFVKPHLKREVCLGLDLKDFFPSISTGRVYGLLRRMKCSRDVAHMIALLTTVRTSRHVLESVYSEAPLPPGLWSAVYAKRHLPQGAPTSPAIANLCAFGLDVRLSGLARRIGGVHYSRYADDILFSGDGDLARQANRLKPLIGAIAIEEGFDVNFRKWRLMRSSQRQCAAGVVLNAGSNVDRESYDRLKATLHNCVVRGPSSQNRTAEINFRQHLSGRIQWVERLNPHRGGKLRAIFERIDWSR